MIQLPTKTQLADLRAWQKPDCVTIYSPYIATNSASKNPNQTQLKVLLAEAEKILLDKHLSQREINHILEPGIKLIDSDEFTTNSKHGLVLFMHHDFFDFYHLPTEDVGRSVIVGKGFKLWPIVKLIDFNLNYYVLLISSNRTKLFKGDSYHMKEIKIQKKPMTMMQELNIDELPKDRGLHSVARADAEKGSKRFHVQFEKSQMNKNLLTMYFRRVDKRLNRLIRNKKRPLILAGVDALLPIYRKINTYPHLSKDELKGNFEHIPLNVIREQVCKIVSDSQTETNFKNIITKIK